MQTTHDPLPYEVRSRWPHLPSVGLLAPALAMLLCVAAPAQQEVWRIETPAGATNRSGLTLSLEQPLFDTSVATRPVRFRVATADGRPSPTDRVLEIELHLRVTFRYSTDILVEIKLPEGQTFAERDFPGWHFANIANYPGQSLIVREAGRIHDDLSVKDLDLAAPNGQRWWGSHPLRILLIDSDVTTQVTVTTGTGNPRRSFVRSPALESSDGRLARLDGLALAFTEVNSFLQGNEEVAAMPQRNLRQARNWYENAPQYNTLLASAEHPLSSTTDWRCYTSWSLVIIPWPDLQQMRQRRPQSFAALRKWVSLGGLLVVLDAHAPQSRAELADLFGSTTDEWSAPPDKLDRQELSAKWVRVVMQNASDSRNSGSQLGLTGKRPSAAFDPLQSTYALRYRFGHVFTGDEESLARSALPWSWMLTTPSIHKLAIEDQSSASLSSDSKHYGAESIPGAMNVPIGWFVALIVLFLALIGPINLRWVRYRNAPILILVSSPAIAAVAIVLLLGITIATDGVRTRGTVRSITWLDSEQGEACSWSHQSYYSFLAPSHLTFPRDSFVVPFAGRNRGMLSYRFHYGFDRFALQGNFLRSRDVVHVRAGSIVETDRRLKAAKDGDGKMQVRNQLGSKVLFLALCDADNSWYIGTEIKHGSTSKLRESTHSGTLQAIDKWQKAETVSPSTTLNWYALANRFKSSQATERTEHELHRVWALLDIEPGEFVALVESSNLVPAGIPSINRSPEIEVVIGKW